MKSLIVLGAHDGDENNEKHRVCMDAVIRQINSLTTLTLEDEHGILKNYPVTLYLGGDNKFLSSCIGHSGASSEEDCYLCHNKY